MKNPDYAAVAERIFAESFSDAACAFVAESIVKGEGTASSDIDIIILYDDDTSETYRRSLTAEGWPVEIFAHNIKSQNYFFQEDIKRGHCATCSMVFEGLVIGKNTELAVSRKKLAEQIIVKGPRPFTQDSINASRYSLTDRLDDLRYPKDLDYNAGILAEHFTALGEFYLRAQNKWSGTGKTLVRLLKQDNLEFAQQFLLAFRRAQTNDNSLVEKLTNDVLAPYGGMLFDEYKSVSNSWKHTQ